ncbi:sulfotransferase [Terasakiella pusilla]|uniref:sulfotransferase n=1 Tax=Terasakiella pusilla TaxID=64973 RepID=UPI003AA7EAC5
MNNDSSHEKLYYGALHELQNCIKTHLFLICPNNSGSTFLKGVMANSRHTWNLKREGQHMAGFQGVSTSEIGAELLWATEKWLKYFTDEAAFNWPMSKKAWYFTATARDPEASVFFTKSPPAIVWVEQLKRHFHNSKFIFMVRDPYAVVEGISRRKQHRYPRTELLTLASEHIMKCFELQIENIENNPQAVFFTYEFLCAEPEQAKSMLNALVPELVDLTFDAKIPVKGSYFEPLRNMNEQQINTLSKQDLTIINRVFDRYPRNFDYFKYQRVN